MRCCSHHRRQIQQQREKDMRATRLGVAAISLSVAAAGLLMAPAVSADQIWYQSVGRANSTATCQDSSAAELASGWTSWRGSWEQWANGGKGGFTCTRDITWAKSAGASSVTTVGCQQIETGGSGIWANFGISIALPVGSASYSNAACSAPIGTTTNILVYTTSQPVAQAECPRGETASTSAPLPADIYMCT